jgi:predicted RNA polymerase sigma factor
MEDLKGELAVYQPYHAARAALLARNGMDTLALAAYDQAIAMASSPADAAFLSRKRSELSVKA